MALSCAPMLPGAAMATAADGARSVDMTKAVPVTPNNASATGETTSSGAGATDSATASSNSSASSSAGSTVHSLNKESYPSSYYLTNLGQVTPVKLQNPWEDCWAFAVASAIESSILKVVARENDTIAKAEEALAAEVAAAQEADAAAAAEKKPEEAPAPADVVAVETNDEGDITNMTPAPSSSSGSSDSKDSGIRTDGFIKNVPEVPKSAGIAKLTNLNADIDVSERALAWFAHETQTETSSGSQSGEGFFRLHPDNLFTQLSEGNFEMIESQLIARQSLLSEHAVPYRYNNYDGAPAWYNSTALTGSANDPRTLDWSVSEDLRLSTELGWRVSDVYKLKSPAVLEYDADYADYVYKGYYAPATRAIKGALMEVGAVAISLETETHLPAEVSQQRGDAPASEHFDYTTWTQYNAAEYIFDNHAVTIVGWDDNFSADFFNGTTSGHPPGNGAWLCKNNWGSNALFEAEGDPDAASHWGIVDEEAGSTGFFWLSFYDHSISTPTAFGVERVEGAAPGTGGTVAKGPAGYRPDVSHIYQYDYLGAAEYASPIMYDSEVWVANVFTAEDAELLRSVSARTFGENEVVDVEVYLLPAEEDAGAATMTPAEATASLLAAQAAAEEQVAEAVAEGDAGVEGADGAADAADAAGALGAPLATDLSGTPATTVMVSPAEDLFAKAQLITRKTARFEQPGFYRVELAQPVLLHAGERFAIAEHIQGKATDSTGLAYDSSYLNLELAFLQNIPNNPQTTMATAVANDGETYIKIDGIWTSVQEFDALYNAPKVKAGGAKEMTFGNALVKAYTGDTTIAARGQVYQVKPLAKTQQNGIVELGNVSGK